VADPSRDRQGATHPAPDRTIRPDGTLRDANSLPRGYWEAKDTADDLDAEIVKKAARGYSLANTIFEDTRTAVLFQGKREVLRVDLHDPQQLCDLLNQFYAYTEPDIADFEQAIDEFKQRVPELARGLGDIIRDSHESNPRFQAAFNQFFALCQSALNPNIARAAVDEMLIQHLLTERLIRKVFDNPEFTQRNVIAAEVEKVIAALVSKAFNRDEFLRSLDRFYVAIEHAARRCTDWNEKQHFLNTVYERFFQGYSVKVADTHGIVYTPQPIVDFMCASVAEVLQTEFGVSLTDKSVQILDPCTGTGNFIVNLLRRMPQRDLPRMYKQQLFANEVMLLPYYIAALNIEHAYYELTGTYEPFEGLCFVDTLDLAESKQAGFSFMTQANTQRVERQKRTPITVIIGNPPYNTRQQDENDNNKNRKYEVVDKRIRDTFARDSVASNKNPLSDAFVKFYRWAIDRLQGREGIVCLVSNNNFVDQYAFDGMRKHLLEEFTQVWHVDLHGNVRINPKLSGTTHNVFGIQVGVGITVAVRRNMLADRGATGSASHTLHYHRVPENWRKEEKLSWLTEQQDVGRVAWQRLAPDACNAWIVPKHANEYASYLPLGTKTAKAADARVAEAIFALFSNGVKTNRDEVVYDFDQRALSDRVARFIDDYNGEVDRYRRTHPQPDVDAFVRYERIKWSLGLKLALKRGRYASFSPAAVRSTRYRPFCLRWLYFERILNEAVYQFPGIFPTATHESENRTLVVGGYGRKQFSLLANDRISDVNFYVDPAQCVPFYVYDEDGSNRRENITDWALKLFREHYHDDTITKWDIFYYVYGVLHHPGYRAKFADNLKRELPRIPLAPPLDPSPGSNAGVSASSGFRAFSAVGKELAHWHLDYEQVEPYKLQFTEKKTVGNGGAAKAGRADTRTDARGAIGNGPTHAGHRRTIDDLYRVEDKMRLSKDKTALAINPLLTLEGIPPACFEYRLGNRSALDWVIDQYQVTTDKRSGIRSDPNRPDDPEYIVRLVGQVIRVSLETVRIVKGLPDEFC
jgi:predicted helicase